MGRDFENRRRSIEKRSDRDAKLFTRCARNISIAVRAGGSDPEANPSLRRAIQNARAANMPKDKIQGAIDKAAGIGDGAAFEEVTYEGYGPHGSALIVVAATDNPTRTVANVRFAFKKGNGNLGNSGSVSFLFDHWGVFRIDPTGHDAEALELDLIDDGLEALIPGESDTGQPLVILRCARESFASLGAGLDARKIVPISSGFEWVAKNPLELTDAQSEEVLELVVRLEADEDVSEVFTNLG